MHSTIEPELPERLADQRGVRTHHNVGIEEVAVPGTVAEFVIVLSTKFAAVMFVANQLLSFELVAQVQCRGAAQLASHRGTQMVRDTLTQSAVRAATAA